MSVRAHAWSAMLDRSDPEQDADWARFDAWWTGRFGRAPSVESVLFVVGLQAMGRGVPRRMTREEKQDAIAEGSHRILEALGLYRKTGEGEWERTGELPVLSPSRQEKLLRAGIIRYFGNEIPESAP